MAENLACALVIQVVSRSKLGLSSFQPLNLLKSKGSKSPFQVFKLQPAVRNVRDSHSHPTSCQTSSNSSTSEANPELPCLFHCAPASALARRCLDA